MESKWGAKSDSVRMSSIRNVQDSLKSSELNKIKDLIMHVVQKVLFRSLARDKGYKHVWKTVSAIEITPGMTE